MTEKVKSIALAIRPSGDLTLEPDPSRMAVRFVFHHRGTVAHLPLEVALEAPPEVVWAHVVCLFAHVVGFIPDWDMETAKHMVGAVRQAALGCAMGPSPSEHVMVHSMMEQLDREIMADIRFLEHTQQELEDGVMKADIAMPLSSDQKQDLQRQIGRLWEKEK